MNLPYDPDLANAFEAEALALEARLFAETTIVRDLAENAFNGDYLPAECLIMWLWEVFQRAHAGGRLNKYECRAVRDYLSPLFDNEEHRDLVQRWYASVADLHNTEDYYPATIVEIPYFHEILLDTVLPDTATMELIVTEYDNIPDATYLLPILFRVHPNIPRSILVEAIYELHQFAGELYPNDPIPFATVPCTL